MRSRFEAVGILSLSLFMAACTDDSQPSERALPTGPPAPLNVLSANISCSACPDAAVLRPPWLELLVAECEPDVVMVQGLASREDMEALAAVLPEHESFYLGKKGEQPENFEAVTWLRRDGFVLSGWTGHYFLTPDRTPNTRFEEAEELHAVVGAVSRDCRSDLAYAWDHTVLEENPVVQEESLDIIGKSSWISLVHPVVLAGAFGIAVTDPLYPKLLSPPGATEMPMNTMDLAESRDTSAVPNVDLQQLTDHVLVAIRQVPWRVPQWSLGTVLLTGSPVTDHPPICVVLLEGDLAGSRQTVAQSKSCRNGGS